MPRTLRGRVMLGLIVVGLPGLVWLLAFMPRSPVPNPEMGQIYRIPGRHGSDYLTLPDFIIAILLLVDLLTLFFMARMGRRPRP